MAGAGGLCQSFGAFVLNLWLAVFPQLWKIPAIISSVVISTLVSSFFGSNRMCWTFLFTVFLYSSSVFLSLCVHQSSHIIHGEVQFFFS